jgi:hypothetical protein
MRGLHRRLAKLERVVDPPPTEPRVSALALNTGAGDLAFAGGQWLPYPNATAILRNNNGPLKVYAGFDPREI